jgi:ribose transport system substrate-binding protein
VIADTKGEENTMTARSVVSLLGTAGLLALSGAFSLPGHAAGKTYTIYLSNNFLGNDWRQQMLRTAAVSVKKGPLAGRVDLHVENVETTTQAQINSLNNIIRTKPDAILVDAGSASALNPTIEKACAAGIVVVSFDQVVTADCAYKVSSNWDTMTHDLATWMVAAIGGKGKVLVDRGLAGAPISDMLEKGFEAVLKQHPDIQIVGYFNGNYALGPEQTGVASLLAANPQIDGVLTQGYGVGAIKAFQEAGRPLVPVTGFSYNVAGVTCAQTPGTKCILGSNPAYLSAEAIKLAVSILDGAKPESKVIQLESPRLATDVLPAPYTPGAQIEKLEVGKNAFPSQPPGLTLPVSPSWVEITPQEAAGS